MLYVAEVTYILQKRNDFISVTKPIFCTFHTLNYYTPKRIISHKQSFRIISTKHLERHLELEPIRK